MLEGRRIAVFGLAFKGATDDLRSSPALDVAARLLGAGAAIVGFDPVVKQLPPELVLGAGWEENAA